MHEYENKNKTDYGTLEDMYDALSGGGLNTNDKVIAGHGVEYYRDTRSRANELIANYNQLKIANKETLEIFKEDKPAIAEALEKELEMIRKEIGGM